MAKELRDGSEALREGVRGRFKGRSFMRGWALAGCSMAVQDEVGGFYQDVVETPAPEKRSIRQLRQWFEDNDELGGGADPYITAIKTYVTGLSLSSIWRSNLEEGFTLETAHDFVEFAGGVAGASEAQKTNAKARFTTWFG